MHETTQRRVCRVAFLALCVVPTLWTLAWIAYSYRPWRQEDWRRTIAERFHVRASVEGIQFPRPGVTKLAKLQISDLRSERLLATIRELRIENRRSRLALAAGRVEVQAGQLQAFATVVETCFGNTNLPPLAFRADELTLVSPQGDLLELSNLRVRAEADHAAKGQLQLEADAREVGQGRARSTIRLTIKNQRESGSPRFIASMDTQQAQLPAWLIADLVPGMGRCQNATFAGAIQIEQNSAGNSGKLHGRFQRIDLQQWIGPLAPNRLLGIGSLQLDNFQWHTGRVTLVEGQLRAGPGRIDPTLLKRLVERVLCTTGSPLTTRKTIADDGLQRFDELGCGFRITNAGITISGLCKTASGETGTLLAVDGRSLLVQPSHTNIPIARLVQVLMPPPTGWLPLSREAIAMATGLPLPAATPPVPREVASREEKKRSATR